MTNNISEADQRGPVWTKHARAQWREPRRNDVSGRALDRGFRESQRVEYPSAKEGAHGRYHAEGECVLICKYDHIDGVVRPVVVTVINLRDRPPWERYYVRCQTRFGGGA